MTFPLEAAFQADRSGVIMVGGTIAPRTEFIRMSTQPQHRTDPPGHDSDRRDEWVQVPAIVDVEGNKIISLYHDQGRPQTRLLAELVLEALVGPRPPGHVVRFKDGNRLNCERTNLEWVPAPARRDEAARAGNRNPRAARPAFVASRAGHKGQRLLVAEDRLRSRLSSIPAS